MKRNNNDATNSSEFIFIGFPNNLLVIFLMFLSKCLQSLQAQIPAFYFFIFALKVFQDVSDSQSCDNLSKKRKSNLYDKISRHIFLFSLSCLIESKGFEYYLYFLYFHERQWEFIIDRAISLIILYISTINVAVFMNNGTFITPPIIYFFQQCSHLILYTV